MLSCFAASWGAFLFDAAARKRRFNPSRKAKANAHARLSFHTRDRMLASSQPSRGLLRTRLADRPSRCL